MTEWQLFEPGTVPEHTTPQWYAGRETAPHVDQAEHRGRLLLARDMVLDAVDRYGCESIVDLGCGDGGLLSLIAERTSTLAWGYDLQQTNVDAAWEKRGIADVYLADVVNDPGAMMLWGELAVATEMLEHLLEPHEFVRRIGAYSRVIVASSPFTERPGSAYEFHTWCWDMPGYRALVEQAGFHVERHETTSQFQVLMGVKP